MPEYRIGVITDFFFCNKVIIIIVIAGLAIL